MPILNYTTSIAAAKSVGEIQAMLVRHGAHRVMVEYLPVGAPDRSPVGLSFIVDVGGTPAAFRLPAKIDGVLSALKRQIGRGRVTRGMACREHATRVAWRILRDWVEVQLALVDAELATVDEVMLPYMLSGAGDRTVYEEVCDQRRALPGPGKG